MLLLTQSAMASTGRDTEEASLSQPPGDAAKQHNFGKVGFSLGPFHSTGDSIQGLDWVQLQEVYANVMDSHGKAEEEVKTQTSNLLEVFMSWSQATLVHDETRALKRSVCDSMLSWNRFEISDGVF